MKINVRPILMLLLSLFIMACGDDNDPAPGPPEPPGPSEPPVPQVINIPDDAFRNYCLSEFDFNGDGKFMTDEAERVTELFISGMEIKNLTGLEYFTALEYFDCSYNPIAGVLDLSANEKLVEADCSHCYIPLINATRRLTGVVPGKQKGLKVLKCSGNAIKELDVSGLPALEELHCQQNSIVSLDTSDTPSLSNLYCANNHIGSLDVSGNVKLKELSTSNNALSELRLPAAPDMINLALDNNMVRTLDLNGLTSLTRINCRGNKIAELDFSTNGALEFIDVSDNPLTDIRLAGAVALATLDADWCEMTRLDISANTALGRLNCSRSEKLDQIKVWSGFDIDTPPQYFSKPEAARYVYDFE